MKIDEFLLDRYGYNSEIKDEIEDYVANWKSWYKGNVKDFHNYIIYNGKKENKLRRYTLNMAKEVCEDWSDILWSEKCKISLNNEENQKQFDELTNKLDLWKVINSSLEKSGALGTHATVVRVYDFTTNEDGVVLDVDDSKTQIDQVEFDWIFPISWDSTGIRDCAFGSIEYNNGQEYLVLSVHKIESDGNYHIHNHLFLKENDKLTEIIENDNIAEDFNTESDIKWFSVFEPLLTNNLFSNSPFGISHFANAIDNLKAVDISFDALKNEIQDGRKRIFARADMFNYDDGEQRLVFDPNDISIYQLPNGANKDDLIQSDNDTLRTAQEIEAINTNLNLLGNKVGFGENHYHFDGSNLSTATAVVSSNSKLFRRKKKLEIGYESAIYDLVQAICYASSKFGKYNINTEDMVIQFDDSIIEDKESESNRAMREQQQGLISKVEYRMRIFGETQEIAEENIRKIKEEEPTTKDLIGE
ncbi:MAG: hypothetical protein KBT03_03720 [Bacteroidales bacterium]|nr:hypothetical protein [Candidatus Scybalousia scybalohippi]